MKNLYIAFIAVFLYVSSIFAATMSGKKTSEIENCSSLKSEASTISEWKNRKNLLMASFKGTSPDNYRTIVFLQDKSICQPILYTWSSKATFKKQEGSDYPNIVIEWFSDNDKNQTIFTWRENKYVSNELNKTYKFNDDALSIFKAGKTKEAISMWERALNIAKTPDYGITSNTEILNNLGFAYYKLAEETDDQKYLDQAEKYLLYVRATDKDRWIVYLNLGDLYAKKGEIIEALENYRTLLKLNPRYKFAKEIKEKMALLEKQDLIEQIVTFDVHPALPQYKLRLSIFNNEHALYRIYVSISNNPEVIQTLNFLEKEGKDCDPAYEVDSYAANITEDINFDGYNDLKILCSWGGAGRTSFVYWLFDKGKGRFDFGSRIALSQPSLDSVKKEIIEFENWGHAGMLYKQRHYKFIKGKITLLKEIDQTEEVYKEDKLFYRQIISIPKNGKMEIVSDTLVDGREN